MSLETPVVRLHLLNGPYVTVDGARRTVPEGSKRLLVLVALRGCVTRRTAAEVLWPDVDARRAAGNLRSAAWRLRCAELALLIERDGLLRVAPEVSIDVDLLCRQAKETAATTGRGDAVGDDPGTLAAATDALDLLPGWYEEWVSIERERVRTQMLRLIDTIAVALRRAGRCAEAIDAALVAVTADPLRESSQGALITAHLGEGNLGEARRAYGTYWRLLRTEFGIEPTPRLSQLVGARTGPGMAERGQTPPTSRPRLMPR